jgi:hypothetical protein
MSFSKPNGGHRKIMLYGPAAGVLLPLLLGGSAAMAMGNMGDPSAAMKANEAAYPWFFANHRDAAATPAPREAQRCRNPPGPEATDRGCRWR